MKRYFCDRCGKEIMTFITNERDYKYIKLEALETTQGITITFNDFPVQSTDLCSICVRKLMFWLLQTEEKAKGGGKK